MKRESYMLIPALDSTGRALHCSVDWDGFLTELERSVADAFVPCSSSSSSSSTCLGSGIGLHDKQLSDRALVALALIQYSPTHPTADVPVTICPRYARADIFEESSWDESQCTLLLQHASAFTPPLAALGASQLSQFFRDRAVSLLLASTLSGADDGCSWLILASAAVGSGSLTAALDHLANAHQLDVTEACAWSNRSIVLQLKGDHGAAFEALKQAITLRFVPAPIPFSCQH
jgi:hypothetical protein